MTSIAEAPPTPLIPLPIRLIAPYITLALAIWIAYGNIYDNAFLFDDDLLIRMNSYLRDWSHFGNILHGSTTSGAHIAGGFYRPMQIFLYVVMYQLGDGSTLGFHLLNLGIHIANACLVYRLGVKLNFARGGAFLAALVWGVHTLHTEAITYMSATADPLFAFFCLLGVCFVLPEKGNGELSWRRIFGVMPIFALGIASKETTVILPLLIMSCLFYQSPQRMNWRTYVRTAPLWIITLGYSYWRANAPGLDGPQTYQHLYQLHEFAALKMYADHPVYRFYTFLASLPIYLSLLANPVGLHMERAFSIYTTLDAPPVLVGLGLFIAVATQILRQAVRPGRSLALAWGLAWFFCAHAPDSGLLVPMNSLFLEHWMYLPSVGLFLGIAETLAQLGKNRAVAWRVAGVTAALGFALMLGVRTYAQNEIWHDPVSFYSNIFAHNEKSARSHNNLALYYSDKGDYPNALEQFKQAIAISDTYAETHYNIAVTYAHMPNQAEAQSEIFKELNRALEIDPHFYRAWTSLASIYELQGNTAKAQECRARATASFKP